MSLDADLVALAGEVRPIDPTCADRLAALSLAVSTNADTRAWDGVDVIGAINPDGTTDRLRRQPLVSPTVARDERWRNLLALMPIALTWFSLGVATKGYRSAVTADPTLLTRPFLLLWEEGFDGHLAAPWSWITLSHVAFFDVILLGVMLFLTWRLHSQINVAQAQRETQAQQLGDRLHRMAWQASLVIAERNSSQGLLDQVRASNELLLNELRAERERIAKIADEREGLLRDLERVATGFRRGAEQILRGSNETKAAIELFQRLAATLDSRTSALEQRELELEVALKAMAAALGTHNSAHIGAVDTLKQTALLMQDTVEKAAIGQAAFGQTANQIGANIAELRDYLTKEFQAYQAASSSSQQAAKALGDVLAATGGTTSQLQQAAVDLRAVSSTLQQTGAGLSTLTGQLTLAVSAETGAASSLSDAGTKNATSANRLAAAAQASEQRVQRAVEGVEKAAAALAAFDARLARLLTTQEMAQQQMDKIIQQGLAVSGVAKGDHDGPFRIFRR